MRSEGVDGLMVDGEMVDGAGEQGSNGEELMVDGEEVGGKGVKRRWSWVGTRERNQLDGSAIAQLPCWSSRKDWMISWPPEMCDRNTCIKPLT